MNNQNNNNSKETVWDAKLYDTKHDFVSKGGESLIPILNPQPDEKILDLGCGSGILTNQIASQCAKVIGIDAAVTMIDQARSNFPNLEFVVADASNFDLGNDYDAVFSNAALHWMLEPEKPVRCVYNALKPGGRFVFEMGGKGNIQTIISAINYAASQIKLDNRARINYFPSIAEYSSILENIGFIVKYALLYERPTPLTGKEGLRNWIKMFRNGVLAELNQDQVEQLFTLAEEYAKPILLKNDGYVADYVRLRMIAYKL